MNGEILILISAMIFSVLCCVMTFQMISGRRAYAEAKDQLENHARSIKMSLVALRGRCTEAIDVGEVLETPAARHFARDIGWALIALENDLGSLLPECDESLLFNQRIAANGSKKADAQKGTDDARTR